MKKIISSFLACTLIVFSCISAFSVKEGESEFCLKIVHTNDIHSKRNIKSEDNSKNTAVG